MKAVTIKRSPSGTAVGISDLPKPELKHDTDVIVRVLSVGLNGTDREIIQEGYGAFPQGEDEMVIGHESLGVVAEAGKHSSFKKGDLVTALVRRPCSDPACVNCRNGRADFCETGAYTERGIKGAHGFLSEYYAEDARYLVAVPKEAAAFGMLAEPQSIVEKVWDQVQRIQQRLVWEPKTAFILGSGPLGLLAAMTCRSLGLDTFVWSKSEETSLQAELVRRIGAHYRQADALKDGFAEQTLRLKEYAETIGRRVDLMFECTGYSPLAFEAMEVVGANGVLALLGVTPGNTMLNISADQLNKELVLENKCILGSVNASRKDFETGIYRLQQIDRQFKGVLGQVITDRMSLEEVHSIDFKRVEIKAVADVVPPSQWESLISPEEAARYSFSV
ncbi:glucose 1-dehydrogenase [Ferviditalea candida]|uniref:Glucose 1-dehydrogenase n=1 Tax=Ferviditalea candida TaxID=3108399 RepID=A0ABU5ZGA2_9BACL|nr:glucose 1-dehydrogenase [Paenibacillaceae bacterium T2]